MKLEVGKYYKTREGKKVKVTDYNKGYYFPYTVMTEEGDKKHYTKNGEYWAPERHSPHDIVSLWEEEPLQLEVGKTYLDRKGRKISIIEKSFFNVPYPFIGEEVTTELRFSFTESGKYLKSLISSRDLVSIYTEKTNNMKYKLKQEFDTLTIHKVVEGFIGCSWGRFITRKEEIDTLKELKILDVWFEKVEEEIITMGSGDNTFTLKIRDDKVFHKDEDITEYVINLVLIYYYPKTVLPCRPAHVKEVTFSRTGCEGVETTLSEWKNVYDKIKKS